MNPENKDGASSDLTPPLIILAGNLRRKLRDPEKILAFAAELVGLVLADINKGLENPPADNDTQNPI